VVRQPTGEVVFDNERACGRGSAQHCRAPAGGEHGTGGVVIGGLAEKRLGARAGEGFSEVPGDDTVPVCGHRHRTDARCPRSSQGSRIGRRLDQKRSPDGDQGAERR
jgi:hypothetical protein